MHSRLRLPFRFRSHFKALKISIFAVLIFGFCFSQPQFVHSQDLPIQALHSFIDNGTYALQVPGKTRHAYNIDTTFIPASTIKVLTSLMALDSLGSEYRFKTYFYLDKANNLYIKGEGDPFLTSEVIQQIARELVQLKIDNINTLVFDSSAFELEDLPDRSTSTDNPYDAESGALAVNFNTISFVVTTKHKVLSGEKQTPFLPIMENLGSFYPQGRYRINVNSLPVKGKTNNTIRYCGELFSALLGEQGIAIANGFISGTVPDNIDPLLVYTSEKNVSDMVRLCLQYSTNFIANQLFLICGSKEFGFPATWEKARLAVQQYSSERLGISPSQIRQVDGSGLSRNNRISAAAMLTVLNTFKPHAQLLPQHQSIYIKSGTLNDVYSYVGYFKRSNELAPFVIFLNQKRNTRDKVLQLIEKEYKKITQSP